MDTRDRRPPRSAPMVPRVYGVRLRGRVSCRGEASTGQSGVPAARPAAGTCQRDCPAGPRGRLWLVSARGRLIVHGKPGSDARSCMMTGRLFDAWRCSSAHIAACRINGAPSPGRSGRWGQWRVPQNFLFPQRDQPLLLPAGHASGYPRTIWCSSCWTRWPPWIWASSAAVTGPRHGRAASGPEMMAGAAAVWLLPGRAVQPGDREAVRAGRGLPGDHRRAAPDHATMARFRARHEKALGGLLQPLPAGWALLVAAWTPGATPRSGLRMVITSGLRWWAMPSSTS